MKSPQIELILVKFIKLQSLCRQGSQTSSRAVAVKTLEKRSGGSSKLLKMLLVNLKRT